MNKQTEKVRRYQAARVRLPSIVLTTVDSANLYACMVRHGTTAGVAVKHGRNAILCELNPEYAELIPARVGGIAGSARNST